MQSPHCCLPTCCPSLRYHNTYITGGCWSPSRPGVFFSTQMDGTLNVWDLHYKHTDPTLQVCVLGGRGAGIAQS